ncbi:MULTISPECIES: toll/interleukin-1 receptor domain-containing protein [unclassified Frankia]|uniref:toll/interleukin-1 receptor domain-containing protein n=1 Tax=unclassified Frankia TaxID=2632575 RepID=UPI0027DE125C|nr:MULTISPECIES: toll/interleukin-1 receptor domain-containing protein [unclassified Frankia]
MIDVAGGPGVRGTPDGWHFFVSYTGVDQPWAEWIAWQLEDAGYRVLIQVWDFVAGSNWQIRMIEGMEQAQRTVAVLSPAYLSSVYGQSEWQAAHRADPSGFARKLLPIRIEPCPQPRPLDAIVSIDLFDLDARAASKHLLDHVRHALAGRAKPATAPDFPARRLHQPTSEPLFPVDQPEGSDRSIEPSDERKLVDLLAHRRSVLGPDHVETLAAAHDLAVALRRNGNYRAGRPLIEDTLIRRRRVLGLDHVDTLSTAHELSLARYGDRDHQAARALAEDTLERCRRVLGADHADTHAIASLLGSVSSR